jgi:integrase/recombinase XerD
MPAPKPKKLGPGRFQARFQASGKDYDRIFTSLEDAVEFTKQNWQPKSRHVRSPVGRLRRHVKEFLATQTLRRLSGSWIIGLSQMLERNFLPYCESVGVTDTSKIDAALLRGYMRWWFAHAPFGNRASTNKTANYASTWDKYRQAISSFCNWAIQRDILIKNPAGAEELKPKFKKKVPDTFEPDEIRKIVAYLDTEHPYKGIFIRLLIYTGLRLSEAAELRWVDVNLGKATIKVKYSSKSDRERTIPIASELLPYLERLPQKTRLLFEDGQGRPFQNRKTYWSDIQRACYMTGIRRRRLHDLRHSCARFLIESNTDIVTVQNILGHEDIRTTQKYMQHFNLTLATEAVNRIKLE